MISYKERRDHQALLKSMYNTKGEDVFTETNDSSGPVAWFPATLSEGILDVCDGVVWLNREEAFVEFNRNFGLKPVVLASCNGRYCYVEEVGRRYGRTPEKTFPIPDILTELTTAKFKNAVPKVETQRHVLRSMPGWTPVLASSEDGARLVESFSKKFSDGCVSISLYECGGFYHCVAARTSNDKPDVFGVDVMNIVARSVCETVAEAGEVGASIKGRVLRSTSADQFARALPSEEIVDHGSICEFVLKFNDDISECNDKLMLVAALCCGNGNARVLKESWSSFRDAFYSEPDVAPALNDINEEASKTHNECTAGMELKDLPLSEVSKADRIESQQVSESDEIRPTWEMVYEGERFSWPRLTDNPIRDSLSETSVKLTEAKDDADIEDLPDPSNLKGYIGSDEDSEKGIYRFDNERSARKFSRKLSRIDYDPIVTTSDDDAGEWIVCIATQIKNDSNKDQNSEEVSELESVQEADDSAGKPTNKEMHFASKLIGKELDKLEDKGVDKNKSKIETIKSVQNFIAKIYKWDSHENFIKGPTAKDFKAVLKYLYDDADDKNQPWEKEAIEKSHGWLFLTSKSLKEGLQDDGIDEARAKKDTDTVEKPKDIVDPELWTPVKRGAGKYPITGNSTDNGGTADTAFTNETKDMDMKDKIRAHVESMLSLYKKNSGWKRVTDDDTLDELEDLGSDLEEIQYGKFDGLKDFKEDDAVDLFAAVDYKIKKKTDLKCVTMIDYDTGDVRLVRVAAKKELSDHLHGDILDETPRIAEKCPRCGKKQKRFYKDRLGKRCCLSCVSQPEKRGPIMDNNSFEEFLDQDESIQE